MIVNAGIVRVVTEGPYPDDLASEMLRSAGIEVASLSCTVPEAVR
jgi:deoxycytidylate deaminase